MKFIDLFAGIGGFRLGLERTGYEPVGWIENDKFARKSYEAIYEPGGEFTARDIREVEPEELPGHDMLLGGFPCQSFSIIGDRNGTEDRRGNLFFEIVRLAKERQPRYILLENVPGLLSSDKGKDFLFIIDSLEQMGYESEWQMLNSRHFGVPQNRERVFIVAHLGGISRRPIFPIRKETKEFDSQIGQRFVVNNKGEWKEKSYSMAIDHNYHKGFDNHGQRTGVKKDGKIRKLTPKECWRLQGFPDWAFERAEQVNSDTQLYRQAGNAVTVNVIEAIGERIGNPEFGG